MAYMQYYTRYVICMGSKRYLLLIYHIVIVAKLKKIASCGWFACMLLFVMPAMLCCFLVIRQRAWRELFLLPIRPLLVLCLTAHLTTDAFQRHLLSFGGKPAVWRERGGAGWDGMPAGFERPPSLLLLAFAWKKALLEGKRKLLFIYTLFFPVLLYLLVVDGRLLRRCSRLKWATARPDSHFF